MDDGARWSETDSMWDQQHNNNCNIFISLEMKCGVTMMDLKFYHKHNGTKHLSHAGWRAEPPTQTFPNKQLNPNNKRVTFRGLVI